MVILTGLALLEAALSAFFLYFFLFVSANEYILGGLMAGQLVVVSLFLIAYYRVSVTVEELTENRGEEYLW